MFELTTCLIYILMLGWVLVFLLTWCALNFWFFACMSLSLSVRSQSSVFLPVSLCTITIMYMYCVSHNHVFVSLHVYVHNHMYLCLCRRLPCADRLLAVRAHSSPWKKGPEYAQEYARVCTRVCALLSGVEHKSMRPVQQSGFSWICIMFLKTWSISSLVTSTSQQPSTVKRYVVNIYVKHLSAPLCGEWWARMPVLMGDQEHIGRAGGCGISMRWNSEIFYILTWLPASHCFGLS